MNPKTVTLLRRFRRSGPGLGSWDFLDQSAGGTPKLWHDLIAGYRTLILADPGAGKTFEAKAQAASLNIRGKPSFFIRLEFLNADFENAFEVGNRGSFDDWLASDHEGWFFLDSVDEAQLDRPSALEDALRVFGKRIHDARERAHVFITSRDDAWQALPERRLVAEYLPHSSLQLPDGNEADQLPADGLDIFRLLGLNMDEIRMFAVHQGVGDIVSFLAELERNSLLSLAENPFDLLGLSRVWAADQALGSRLDVLDRMIDLQLDPARGPSLIKIDLPRRRRASALLAAAVTMTGKTKICCPDGEMSDDRIDCRQVLGHFNDSERAELLSFGVFDDKVYGAVRFRHREVRERLTAEWAVDLLQTTEGRRRIEDLCIRERYGERVLVPRMRPILPWLILFDDDIRDQVLAIDPTIASAGGDPSKLPLDIRRTMLREIVDGIAERRA